MKSTLVFIAFTFVSQIGFSQDQKVTKILTVYEKGIIPYLMDMAKNEHPEIKNQLDSELVQSRVEVLKAETLSLSDDINQKIKDGKIDASNQEIFLRVVDFEYRNNFPGIKRDFFDKTHEEVRKLKL